MNNLQITGETPVASIRQDSWLNGDTLNHLCRVAEMMAGSRVTIPSHLSGNNGDCLAVCMQAMQWGMNPFAVAQKTFMVGSTLGYEAQLVNAVITSMAPIQERLNFKFFGDWDKVLGKIQIKINKDGKKYSSPDWLPADEDGVGVTVFATLKGEDKPRSIDVMLKQCFPRNSTQWANDPQQQITYAGVKKWGRRYCPDVILGVYTPDELEEANTTPQEKEINPVDQSSKEIKQYPQEDFDKNFESWKSKIESGRNTASRIISMVEAKGALTEEMKAKLTAVTVKQVEEGETHEAN
jgi:hypothetical protein